MLEGALRVGLIQQSADPEPEHNLERAERSVRRAAAEGAQLVCLQELFRSSYFCQEEDARHMDLAEALPGPTSDRLGKLCAELGVVLVAPLFERRAPGLYHNSAAVIDRDGSLVGRYRKMHIPDDPLFYEKFYFAPGDLGFECIDTSLGRIGVQLCWDQWFPEAARLMALQGAQILLYPSAIGWIDGENEAEGRAMREAWTLSQRAHALHNGVFVAAANRVGREGALDFWGSSFVADPQGRVLAQSPSDREDVLVVDCDLAQIEAQRRGWPFLRDRRIDAYGDLLLRMRDRPRRGPGEH